MAFSSTDLSNVESAIVAIAEGKRVVQTDVGGKTRSFQAANIKTLLELRDVIKADVEASSNNGIIAKASFVDVG